MEALIRLGGVLAFTVMALSVYRLARVLEPGPDGIPELRPPVRRRSARLELEVHNHSERRRRPRFRRFQAGLAGWALHLPLPWTHCRCLCVEYFREGKRP
jgi:hypothetical protein